MTEVKTGQQTMITKTENFSPRKIPDYAGTGDLVKRVNGNGNYIATQSFLLRDEQGNVIEDPGQALYRAVAVIAWTYRAAGISNQSVGELTEKLYGMFSENAPDTLFGGLERKIPEPIKIPSGVVAYKFSQATPRGKLHVHLTIDPSRNYDPLETFLSIAKAGAEEAAETEALGRLASFLLRRGWAVEDILDQIGGLGSTKGFVTNGGVISTIEEGFSTALIKYRLTQEIYGMKGVLLGEFDPWEIDDEISEVIRTKKITGANWKSQIQGYSRKVKTVQKASGQKTRNEDNHQSGKSDGERKVHIDGAERCPDCGQQSLIPQAGCNKCIGDGCGYSDCS